MAKVPAARKQMLKERKRRFKAARALANDLTFEQAAKQFGVSAVHLNETLNGNRDSRKLDLKIDAFIEEHLGDRTNLAATA